MYPKVLNDLIESFKKLPGIGEKTAERLSFSLLSFADEDIDLFSDSISNLKKIIKHGGIGFIIVRFTRYEKTFLLDANFLFAFLENETRKSIPFSYFEENGHIISEKYQPRLDYLEIVDNIYF